MIAGAGALASRGSCRAGRGGRRPQGTLFWCGPAKITPRYRPKSTCTRSSLTVLILVNTSRILKNTPMLYRGGTHRQEASRASALFW